MVSDLALAELKHRAEKGDLQGIRGRLRLWRLLFQFDFDHARDDDGRAAPYG
jgi:hypothetical protein